MQRLTRQPWGHRERGATIVTFALFLMVMLGFMGVGIDGAAVFAKRQHVQTGADAAAFALAQEYALTGCVEDSALALTYASPNVPNERASTAIDLVQCGTESGLPFVRVDASAEQPPFFLQSVGAGPIRVPASATVEWGSPVAGTSVLPITISACSYFSTFGANPQVGVRVNIPMPNPSASGTPPTCSYHADYPAGGFNWLDPTGDCEAATVVGGWAPGDTGNSVPMGCDWSDFNEWIGRTILLPIFDESQGVGSHGEYRIVGYAAILFEGFHFNTLSGTKSSGLACTGAPTGAKMCMIGTFQGYSTIDDFELGAPDGTATLVIRLKS